MTPAVGFPFKNMITAVPAEPANNARFQASTLPSNRFHGIEINSTLYSLRRILMLKTRKAIGVCALFSSLSASLAISQNKPRARDLGVPFDGNPGPLNAITDVKGVEVGHTTLIAGTGKLQVGHGPVRTGVTAILPRGKDSVDPCFAAWFSLNGNGEVTGTTWIEESGFLEGPVMLTNTSSV